MITRLLCMLLALCCLCPAVMAESEPGIRGWDKKEGYVYLTLGTFPQTAEGERLPILWRVLSVEDNRAYLVTEYVLEARRIHGDYKEYANKPTHKTKPGFDGDFTKTELALYLNGEFASANFTAGEISLVAPDEVLGHFFLLSSEDLKNAAYGFTSNESRKAWGTEYAKANGLFVYTSRQKSHSPYWSRTQSTSNTQGARCIKAKGDLGYINVITEDEGVRPACYLDMGAVKILSGAGTKEDPFVLDVPAVEAADTTLPDEITLPQED